MPVIVTYIALAGMTLLALSIRLLWPRLSQRRRRQFFIAAAVLLLPALLNTISRWDTTSPHLNAALLWVRLFAYELCIMLFTLLTPRALTTAIAVVLTLPVFSSSVVGPASGLFSTAQPVVRPVAGGYFLELLPWSGGPQRNGGDDFALFYQPPGFHLLRRPFMGARLYSTQCRTADTTASVDLHTARIFVHCPPLTADHFAAPSGTELAYPIPPGAQSTAVARNQHR